MNHTFCGAVRCVESSARLVQLCLRSFSDANTSAIASPDFARAKGLTEGREHGIFRGSRASLRDKHALVEMVDNALANATSAIGWHIVHGSQREEGEMQPQFLLHKMDYTSIFQISVCHGSKRQ